MADKAPRRFWVVTFRKADGSTRRRYIKCPYQIEGGRRLLAPGDAGFVDTYPAMCGGLAALEWDGIIDSFRVTPVRPERIAAIRDRAVRWSTVLAEVAA